ncbi:alpha/beta hydrolase [Pedobacter rhizosphaerae]|uniref:Esterase n=1 Tax=Pedobacter rhizosphaerae TaxID=390241 RepID=A0A1H9TWL4_9SPHI|nr:alpha/beta hydrolase-fold protein [Pedobacter rhizosphaerae]SES01760.1 hypothetical protein SAMN04488023_12535 [Pedobacter rhizosphaerae]
MKLIKYLYRRIDMRATFLFLFLLLNGWLRAQDFKGEEKGNFILGKIFSLQSRILSEERILNIYLPEGYDSTLKYPVIYLLDGSADEDFIHVAGLVQFNTFPWINRIPKSIVVGIANTRRKLNFTSPSNRPSDLKLIPENGGSTAFISFIAEELQPFINKKFATDGNNMIIGQSLGGLLATEILLTKPQLFNRYVIISPSLWWRDGYLLKADPKVFEDYNFSSTSVYIGVGKEGSIDGSKQHIMEKDAKRLAVKLNKLGSGKPALWFDFLKQENHATVTHQAVFNAFRKMFPQK